MLHLDGASSSQTANKSVVGINQAMEEYMAGRAEPFATERPK